MSTPEPHLGPISGWYAHAAWREREVDVHDADCTFSPRISEYSQLLQRSSDPAAMYERGVEFLQERESRRQSEQERLVPSFTPASFTLDHVELAEAAELGSKDPVAMYRRSQWQQQQRESRLHTAAAQGQHTHAPELDEHSRQLTDHASLDPSRATAASRAAVVEAAQGGPPMTAVAAASAAASRQAERVGRTPVRESFHAFVQKSEEQLGRREARRAAGLVAEEARRMEGCTFTPHLYKPGRHVQPRYPRSTRGEDSEEPLASHLTMLEAALDARKIVRPPPPNTAAAGAAAAATPATPATTAAAQLKALLRVPTSSETSLSSRHTAAGTPAELTALSVQDKLQLLENYLEQARAHPPPQPPTLPTDPDPLTLTP